MVRNRLRMKKTFDRSSRTAGFKSISRRRGEGMKVDYFKRIDEKEDNKITITKMMNMQIEKKVDSRS